MVEAQKSRKKLPSQLLTGKLTFYLFVVLFEIHILSCDLVIATCSIRVIPRIQPPRRRDVDPSASLPQLGWEQVDSLVSTTHCMLKVDHRLPNKLSSHIMLDSIVCA